MSDNVHANASGGIGLVTVILALIFLFVWPGPFRYEYREPASAKNASDMAVVKIDRISHEIWDYNWPNQAWEKRIDKK